MNDGLSPNQGHISHNPCSFLVDEVDAYLESHSAIQPFRFSDLPIFGV